MDTPQNLTPATPEEIWAILREIAQQRKEFEQERKKILIESEKERTERKKERTEREKEREKEWKKSQAELAEIRRLVNANNREIGGITKSNGEIAESYFINSFKKHPYFAEQDYQFLDSRISRYSKALELKDEYDLVLINSVSVVIIEIKYKARKEDVEEVLKKADTFKKLMPHYKDFDIYLGLAGLHVYQNAEKEAISQGIAVIKQIGKSMVITDAHLKVF
jgi:hypothetical protein